MSRSSVQRGGWVEVKDIDFFPYSPNGSLPQDSAITAWHSKVLEAASICGIDLRLSSSQLKQYFEEAGFVNVTVEEFILPCGTWPRNKKLKQIGMCLREMINTFEGLEAYSLAIFTKAFGWSRSESDIFIEKAKRETRSQTFNWYWPL
jgi:hypothetical protein